MFDDYLWKSYVHRTTFSNVRYQDLRATIHPSKINNFVYSIKFLVLSNKIEQLQSFVFYKIDYAKYTLRL